MLLTMYLTPLHFLFWEVSVLVCTSLVIAMFVYLLISILGLFGWLFCFVCFCLFVSLLLFFAYSLSDPLSDVWPENISFHDVVYFFNWLLNFIFNTEEFLFYKTPLVDCCSYILKNLDPIKAIFTRAYVFKWPPSLSSRSFQSSCHGDPHRFKLQILGIYCPLPGSTDTYTHMAYIYVHIHMKIKINLFQKVVASTVNSPGNGAFRKSPALS